MYIWRNEQRRDKRNNPADSYNAWIAPKGSENTLVFSSSSSSFSSLISYFLFVI